MLQTGGSSNMWWWARSSGRDGEFSGADAVVWLGRVNGWFGSGGWPKKILPVLLPSSMMRMTIVPRWRTSPCLAGTKFKGTLGVSMSC